MSQTEPKNFMEFLIEWRDDRAMMASLRRGLAQPASAEVSRIVQYWLPENAPRCQEEAYYLVAPLFALHHRSGEDDVADKGNLGSHFREMCEPGEDPPRNVERRFMQLLACDANDLDDLLRQAVSLLKSKGVAVNWQRLLDDVKWWKQSEDNRDKVRKAWSRGFWRSPQSPNDQSAT
jgi:CRISPR system Cascade subunit CasB